MTGDRGRGGEPPEKKHEAVEGTGRKRLGENGFPQTPPTREQQDAANRTKVTVTRKPEPSLHEIKRAVDEE
ncbi:hypothetical protein ACRAWG_36280 [Methylobacterium sp. P31]